jgi:hypothetical protein
MRALPGDVHQALLRSVKSAIAGDSLLGRWLELREPGLAPPLVLEEFSSAPWASMTFSGMRHSLSFRLSGRAIEVEEAYDRLQALLTAPEFALGRHFLAEMEVTDVDAALDMEGGMTMAITIEALTIEE